MSVHSLHEKNNSSSNSTVCPINTISSVITEQLQKYICYVNVGNWYLPVLLCHIWQCDDHTSWQCVFSGMEWKEWTSYIHLHLCFHWQHHYQHSDKLIISTHEQKRINDSHSTWWTPCRVSTLLLTKNSRTFQNHQNIFPEFSQSPPMSEYKNKQHDTKN